MSIAWTYLPFILLGIGALTVSLGLLLALDYLRQRRRERWEQEIESKKPVATPGYQRITAREVRAALATSSTQTSPTIESNPKTDQNIQERKPSPHPNSHQRTQQKMTNPDEMNWSSSQQTASHIGDKSSLQMGFAVGGAALVIIGVFAPIMSAPIAGSMSWFSNGTGDGVIALGLAIGSIFAALTGKARFCRWTGLGILALLGIFFFIFQQRMAEYRTEMAGNIFGQAFANMVQIQWGFGAVLIGAGLLFASSLIKNS